MFVSVFNYSDYRKFLADFFDNQRQNVNSLSLRSICDDIGIKSSRHLTLVLKGQSNISQKLTNVITEYCKLNEGESVYFKTMVFYNQAKGLSTKRIFFEKLSSFPESCVYGVSKHNYKFYDRWYHSVVRAITEFMDVKNNYDQIAQMLSPPVTANEIKNSLELLLQLELIFLDDRGFYHPTVKSTGINESVPYMSLNNFVAGMVTKTQGSVDALPGEKQLLSWITRFTEMTQQANADQVLFKNLTSDTSDSYNAVTSDQEQGEYIWFC
ncbi:MAG: TIGR02147 family protein [Fibrobacteria bacterium]|nr:TIGR02147 family protein [Fibrobacteria bacterium]